MESSKIQNLKYYIISRVSNCIIENANKFYMASKLKKIGYSVQEIFFHIPTVVKILLGKYLFIYQIEMVVTTKCSLRCKDCSNLMQYYKSPYHVDIKKNLKALKNLLDNVDEIGTLTFLGGEPLLYPDLVELLGGVLIAPRLERCA